MEFTAKYLNLIGPDACSSMFKDQPISSLPPLADEITTVQEPRDCHKKLPSGNVPVSPIAPDDLSIAMATCDSASSNTCIASPETKIYPEGFSMDLSLDSIQDHIDIDSSIIPRATDTLEIAENQDPVYPDLIFVSDSTPSDSAIDLNNIQLYLECSDDSENLVTATPTLDSGYEILSNTGTSLLKSDVRLKISFPKYPEDSEKGFKCTVCKSYFIIEDDLRTHITQEHPKEIYMCPICPYNTKSKKFFGTHLKTKHKELIECSGVPNEDVLVALASIQPATSSHELATSNTCNLCDVNAVTLNAQCLCGLGSSRESQISFATRTESFLQDKDSVPVAKEIHYFHPNSVLPTETLTNQAETVSLISNTVGSLQTAQVDEGHCKDFAKSTNSLDDDVHMHVDIADTSCDSDTTVEEYLCQVCSFVTKSSKLLRMHYDTMHNADRTEFKCTQCSYKCKQKRSFLSHMDLHKGDFKFECEICHKKFVSKSMYTRHSKNHSDDRNHICHVEGCRKAFKSKGALTDHRKKVHSVAKQRQSTQDTDTVTELKNDKATCTTIDRLTSKHHKPKVKSSNLDGKHSSKLQTNAKTNQIYGQLEHSMGCLQTDRDQCTPNFELVNSVDSEGDLHKEHPSGQRKTSQSKSFTCSYPNCSKSFRDNFNLRNHMAVHEGVKKLSCSQCSFVCVQKSSLNYHCKTKHAGLSNKG